MRRRAARAAMGLAVVTCALVACERVTTLGEIVDVDGGLTPSDVGPRTDAATDASEDAAPPYVLPTPLTAPGLVVNKVDCTITSASTTGTAFWSSTVEAYCGSLFGYVKILMNGRRDLAYPAYCSESEQATLYAYGDAGTNAAFFRSYRSEGPVPPCAFFSGPGTDAGVHFPDGSSAIVFSGTLVLSLSQHGGTVDVAYFGR